MIVCFEQVMKQTLTSSTLPSKCVPARDASHPYHCIINKTHYRRSRRAMPGAGRNNKCANPGEMRSAGGGVAGAGSYRGVVELAHGEAGQGVAGRRDGERRSAVQQPVRRPERHWSRAAGSTPTLHSHHNPHSLGKYSWRSHTLDGARMHQTRQAWAYG